MKDDRQNKVADAVQLTQCCEAARNRLTHVSVHHQVRVDEDAHDVGVQAEYRSRIDNFGLPPGLCLSAIIRMTRQRGTSIGRPVFLLVCEYAQNMQRGFTQTERSSFWGRVSVAASLCRNEDQEI